MTTRPIYWLALIAATVLIIWRFDFDDLNFWIAEAVLLLGCVAGQVDARAERTP